MRTSRRSLTVLSVLTASSLSQLAGSAAVTVTVTAVAPAIVATGGAAVTVAGAGFSNADHLMLGSTVVNQHPCGAAPAAACFTVISDTQISLFTGPQTPQTFDVQVAASGVTSTTTPADELSVAAAGPQIAGLGPAQAQPGDVIVIRGTNFSAPGSGVAEVRFGPNHASSTLNPDGSLTVTVPPGNGAVDVRVMVQSDDGSTGTASLTGAALFTYGPEPPPAATMTALTAIQHTTGFLVSWSPVANAAPPARVTLWTRDTTTSAPWVSWNTLPASTASATFVGEPGHAYRFYAQAIGVNAARSAAPPGATANPGETSTTVAPDARHTEVFSGAYIVTAYGAIDATSSAPTTPSATWPGWRIVRDIATRPDGKSGYVLDGFGGLHPFGGAPQVQTTGYWPGWDIARAVGLAADGQSGYVLDGYGGLHPFGVPGDIPALPPLTGYWPGHDIGRDVAVRADGVSGYVLDGFGGVHPFGGAPGVAVTGYWPGWDIAHRFVLRADGVSGYVLDGYGGLHPFGGATPVAGSGYWPGWDIARDIDMIPGSPTWGYVVDGYGGMHGIGGAPGVQTSNYLGGHDVVVGLSIH